MRWTWSPSPKKGDTRVVTWFALLPVRIGLETRWLERVRVRQRYFSTTDDDGWENLYFIHSEPENQ